MTENPQAFSKRAFIFLSFYFLFIYLFVYLFIYLFGWGYYDMHYIFSVNKMSKIFSWTLIEERNNKKKAYFEID